MKRILRLFFPAARRRGEVTAGELLKELEHSEEYKHAVAARQSERDAVQRTATAEQVALLAQTPDVPARAKRLRDIERLSPKAIDQFLKALDPRASVATLYEAFALLRRSAPSSSGAQGTISALGRVVSARKDTEGASSEERRQGTEVIVGEALQAIDALAVEADVEAIMQLLEDTSLGIARSFLIPSLRRLAPRMAGEQLHRLNIPLGR